MIGDTGPAGFNIVSGNILGIEVNGGSDRTTIAGNRIGTDYYGKTRRDANTNGVAVVADGLGEAPADITVDQNTIAGSTNYGMYITGGAKRPTLTNNRFGTDVDGVKPLREQDRLRDRRPRSGGEAPTDLVFGPGNVVAGNITDGVQMFGRERRRAAATGSASPPTTKPLGNGSVGLNVQGDGVLVENNTVSANAQGIVRQRPDRRRPCPRQPRRHGARRRADPSWTSATPARACSCSARVGRDTRASAAPAAPTPTSSRATAAASRSRATPTDTTIRQNIIGLDTTATNAIPNDVGVYLAGGTSTVVGGALGIDARNYIARNSDAGIRINGAKQSVIMGNYITDNQRSGRARRRPRRRRGDRLRRRVRRRDRGRQLPRHALQPDREQPGRRRARARRRRRSPCAATACAATPGSTSTSPDQGATANDETDADDWPNTPIGVAADQGRRRPVGAHRRPARPLRRRRTR